MPLLLHPHLKRRLDYDEPDIDPADIIEHVVRDHTGPEEQAAKRQRIEKIASQYLRGRMPVILTASLCGPFDDGWKNPWAEEKKGKRKPKASGASRHRADLDKARPEARRPTRSASRSNAKAQTIESPEPSRAADTVEDDAEIYTRTAARRHSRSPETSRAVDTGVEDHQESHTLDFIEPPPATAPSPPEAASSASNVYSAETTRCIRSHSPMTNPFWLRRPEPDGAFDMRKSTNGTAEASPSHLRGSLPQPGRRRTLQLAQPKAAFGHRVQQRSASPVNNVHSSASASVVISSPVNPVIGEGGSEPGSHTLQAQKTPAGTAGPSPSTFENAHVQPPPAPMPSGIPLTGPGNAAAESTSKPEVLHTSQQGSQQRLSREVIQLSAERLVDLLEPAHSSTTLSKQTTEGAVPGINTGIVGENVPSRLQHNLVASPAPNCSSGFVYKKVGTKKWTIDNAPRSKPRAVNFNSSPANKVAARSESSSQNFKKREEKIAEEQVEAATEAQEEQQSIGSTRSSRQSAMSTQAAMLLAQLEFQESTFPMSSVAVDTPRPWSQPQEETPRPILPEPSPAITPLSVFSPQLQQGHAMTSVLHGPTMSTQDLFAAASPFAMSTVKKKPAASERSSLRMSITSFAGQNDDADDLSSKSPISFRNRIPLAEKNAAPSPWGFGFDKWPRDSQDLAKEHTRLGDVELPQLDFHTSLDGYGSNGSFHFAERILRDFNDT